MTVTSANEEVKLLEISNIVNGNEKWYNHFSNSLAVTYKVKQVTITPKGNENVCTHKILSVNVNVYISWIQNC